jgi:Zeta toxin
MLIIGGQPGAGKSRSIEGIKAELADHGGVMRALVDDLREAHPKYRELMLADDKVAANYTHADAKAWAQKIEDYAKSHRYNVLIESLMTSPDGANAWLQDYRQARYTTEVHIVAVNERSSRQGIVGRYEEQKLESIDNVGRTVPRQVHDAAYGDLLKTVEKVETEKLADRVVVHNRGGQVLYENALQPDGQWQHAPSARQAIVTERVRSLSPTEWRNHIQAYDDIQNNQHRPNRNATTAELDEVQHMRTVSVREGGLTAQVVCIRT